jgi:hypothetical protein
MNGHWLFGGALAVGEQAVVPIDGLDLWGPLQRSGWTDHR